ncbi:MAG: hypothetical protein CMJ81_15510 [Planctomycetaceae bacterium]|nr:hypothetical protein [Planctomycetaceae bacterium]
MSSPKLLEKVSIRENTATVSGTRWATVAVIDRGPDGSLAFDGLPRLPSDTHAVCERTRVLIRERFALTL